MQGVEVARDGFAEPDGGVLLFSQQGAGRSWAAVSGQDLFEQLGRGGGQYRVGPDEGVRVAVADHRNVDVVGGAAAGHHGVELLPGLLTGHDTMHGVGGDALRGMHSGGVTQFGSGADIAGGERDGAAVPYVPHPHPTVPVRLRTVHRSPFFTQSVAVMRSLRSLLRVMIRSPTLARLPSANSISWLRVGVGEAVVAGALVELRDQLPGRGQHDRIESTAAVVLPGVEDGVEGGGGVADVDPLPVEVEAERFGSAVADGEGGGGFGRVGEPVQFGEPDRAITGLDVAEDPAGADRGQLLIITDQPDAAAAADDELDGGVEGEGVGHPGLVDDHQAGPADAFRPSPAGHCGGWTR